MFRNELNENKRTQQQDNTSKRIRIDTLLNNSSNTDAPGMVNEEVYDVLPPQFTVQQKEVTMKGEQALIARAKAAGGRAGRKGSTLKTKAELMTMNHYSEAQAAAYLKAYASAKATVTEEQTLIRKAKAAGAQARRDGSTLKTKEVLMESKNYSEAQAAAYLKAYESAKATVTEEQALFRKAKVAGAKARRDGSTLKTKAELMAMNHYTEAQATAYLEAYASAKATKTEEQILISKGKVAGSQARRNGWTVKTKAELMAINHYTEAQAAAYLKAYAAANSSVLSNKSKQKANHNLNNNLISTSETVPIQHSNRLLRNESVAIAAAVPEEAPQAILNQFSLRKKMKGANVGNQAEVDSGIDANKKKCK